LKRPVVLFAGAVVVFALLMLASSSVGVPHDARGAERLPAVALGWRLLFHVERVSSLMLAIGTVMLVAWRGAHGDWPIKFGNVEYAPKEAVRETADVLADQDERVRLLEELLGVVDDPSAGTR
jgi:hypothetical protein